MTFQQLKDFKDYEILDEYPFTIRRKSNGFEPKEQIKMKDGCVCIMLNRRQYCKHILIAKQFLENDDPNNKMTVSHINRDRGDYHIENLRWTSQSTNQINKSSTRNIQYEFVEKIPKDSKMIEYYNTHKDRKYFDVNKYFYYQDENENDLFYMKLPNSQYRKLHINTDKSGYEFLTMYDVNRKPVQVYINKFKEMIREK